jgi:hypothetical protein
MPYGTKTATCISNVAVWLYDTRIRMTILIFERYFPWIVRGFRHLFSSLYDLACNEFWMRAAVIGCSLSPVVEASLCLSSSSFLSSRSGGMRVAWLHQEASPPADTKCALCQCDKAESVIILTAVCGSLMLWLIADSVAWKGDYTFEIELYKFLIAQTCVNVCHSENSYNYVNDIYINI